MLTRSRYGTFANENAVSNVKEASIGLQKNAKNPKTRFALGDIKNKAVEVISHEVNKLKKFTDAIEKNEVENLKLNVEKQITDETEVTVSVFKKFQMQRRKIREEYMSCNDRIELLDLDNNDFGDAATIYPYGEKIYNYLQNKEMTEQALVANFMDSNPEVTPRMRYILINWLVQVHYSYKLQPETLYLCVALLDRYLLKNCKALTKTCFQLIGIACLFIAAKFEEMYPPDVTDFSAITNNTYKKCDIRNSEKNVLETVNFYLSIPIPLLFLRRLSRAVQADRVVHNLAKYLLELTLQEYDLAYLTGNLRAAVAFCLSRCLCMETENLEEAWNSRLAYLSGYLVDDMRHYFKILARAAYRQNSPSKYRAIYNKYKTDNFYGRVAALPQLRSALMEKLAELKFDSDGEVDVS